MLHLSGLSVYPAQEVMKHFRLREQAGADPQTYALGLKEVWEVRNLAIDSVLPNSIETAADLSGRLCASILYCTVLTPLPCKTCPGRFCAYFILLYASFLCALQRFRISTAQSS